MQAAPPIRQALALTAATDASAPHLIASFAAATASSQQGAAPMKSRHRAIASLRSRSSRRIGHHSMTRRRGGVPRSVKLVEGAQKSWRRLDGHNQLPKIIQGVKFIDGLEIAAKLKAPQANERYRTAVRLPVVAQAQR